MKNTLLLLLTLILSLLIVPATYASAFVKLGDFTGDKPNVKDTLAPVISLKATNANTGKRIFTDGDTVDVKLVDDIPAMIDMKVYGVPIGWGRGTVCPVFKSDNCRTETLKWTRTLSSKELHDVLLQNVGHEELGEWTKSGMGDYLAVLLHNNGAKNSNEVWLHTQIKNEIILQRKDLNGAWFQRKVEEDGTWLQRKGKDGKWLKIKGVVFGFGISCNSRSFRECSAL
jgi:hypothetical protein